MGQSPVLVPLNQIRIDGGTQSRVDADSSLIEEYAEGYKRNAPMPPLLLVDDGEQKWLYGGHHRYGGALLAGLTEVPCEVIQGTLEDARWLALAENKTHGLRRTPADIQHAIKMGLALKPGTPDGELADHIGVARTTILNHRRKLETTCQLDKSSEKVGRDGRTYNTSNIGKRRQDTTPDAATAAEDISFDVAPVSAEPIAAEADNQKVTPTPVDPEPPRQSTPPPATPPAATKATTDAEGTSIPAEVRDVFGDTFLRDTVAKLEQWHASMQVTPIIAGLRARHKHLPWLRIQQFIEQLQEADESLALAIETARQGIPYAVHTDCVGAGCDDCRHSGHLAQWRWEELQGGTR